MLSLSRATTPRMAGPRTASEQRSDRVSIPVAACGAPWSSVRARPPAYGTRDGRATHPAVRRAHPDHRAFPSHRVRGFPQTIGNQQDRETRRREAVNRISGPYAQRRWETPHKPDKSAVRGGGRDPRAAARRRSPRRRPGLRVPVRGAAARHRRRRVGPRARARTRRRDAVVLVGQAGHHRGRPPAAGSGAALGLDDPVAEYVAGWGAGKERVTIRHVLTHTGGFTMVGRDEPFDADISYAEAVARIAAHPAGVGAGHEGRLPPHERVEDPRRHRRGGRRPAHRPLPGRRGARPGGHGRRPPRASPPEEQAALGDRLVPVHWTGHAFAVPRSRAGSGWSRTTSRRSTTRPWHVAKVEPGGGMRGPARELGRFYESLLGLRLARSSSPARSRSWAPSTATTCPTASSAPEDALGPRRAGGRRAERRAGPAGLRARRHGLVPGPVPTPTLGLVLVLVGQRPPRPDQERAADVRLLRRRLPGLRRRARRLRLPARSMSDAFKRQTPT